MAYEKLHPFALLGRPVLLLRCPGPWPLQKWQELMLRYCAHWIGQACSCSGSNILQSWRWASPRSKGPWEKSVAGTRQGIGWVLWQALVVVLVCPDFTSEHLRGRLDAAWSKNENYGMWWHLLKNWYLFPCFRGVVLSPQVRNSAWEDREKKYQVEGSWFQWGRNKSSNFFSALLCKWEVIRMRWKEGSKRYLVDSFLNSPSALWLQA